MSEEIKPKLRFKKSTTAPKKERLQYSGWHMTINTNKKFTKLVNGDASDVDLDALAAANPDFAAEYHKFEEALEAILGNIKPYIRFMEPDKVSTLSKDYFYEFDVNASVELGGAQKSLHGHIHIEAIHKTRIRLDYDKIKADLTAKLGYKVYTKTELLNPGQSQFAKMYVLKGG